jgi:quinol monooxygenase YgiN
VAGSTVLAAEQRVGSRRGIRRIGTAIHTDTFDRYVIVVHTSIPIDPECYDEAIELIEDLTERSRREEGAVRYRATTDITDPYTIRFFEQYEDEAAVQAHTETEYYREFNDRLPGLVDGHIETIQFVTDEPPETYRFDAEELTQGEP